MYRDHHGNWLDGYAMNLGFCSSQAAELWGVTYASMLLELGDTISVDNKKVVEALSKSTEEKIARFNLISN